MKIIFGLGNTGKEFAGTRHNLGAATLAAWEEQATEDECRLATVVFPLGFMNKSGPDLMTEMKRQPVAGELLLIHDDLELPLGECKVVKCGSAKGHKGVRSVLEVWESDEEVTRLRMGIGRPPVNMEASDFVLARFSQDEKEAVAEMTKQAILLIDQFLSPHPENAGL